MQTIVTHSGSFDPDDVLAAAAVSIYLGKDNFEIIRSREREVIDKADWVLDVGGEYDPKTKRFDHHQNGVPKRDNGVPYSAFGLVWREIGESLCGSEAIAKQIETKIVEPIDAADNQVQVCCECTLGIESFEFFDVINAYKPVWGSEEDFDTGFNRAVSFARKLLKRMIAHGQGDEAMRKMITAAYESADDKTILVFDDPVVRNIVADFEEVKVVVCPALGVDITNWMAVAVPKKYKDLRNRALFPEPWAGLTGADLEKESDIEGSVFCHKERYIFVGKTKEAALQAASQIIPQ